MRAFRIFDPYSFLGGDGQPACDDGEHEAKRLAALATLAAAHGEFESGSSNYGSEVTPRGAISGSALRAKSRGDTPAKPAKAANRSGADLSGFAEEKRPPIPEHNAGVPRIWRDGYARLHPGRPPGDVSLLRWQTFINDLERFLDNGWAERSASLGWGPLDLFGCDREQPFARIDHAGLLWLLNGDSLVALDGHKAVIKRLTGSLQTFRRRPLAVGDALLVWELVY
jgi:hypothetical protein